MNEQDGHNILVAKLKALEEIAKDYMLLHALETATEFPSDAELSKRLWKRVDHIVFGNPL